MNDVAIKNAGGALQAKQQLLGRSASRAPEPAASDLPPAAELVEEMEQFLRQQRPE